MLTPAGGSAKVTLHTVKEQQQHTTEYMKKTLLMAAAALAAGIISSQAQPVYSQNIVGYANVSLDGGYNLLVNPFNVGASNGAHEVFSTIPDGSTFLKWGGNGYNTYYYDTSIGLSANNWYLGDQSTPGPVPSVKVGEAFFFQPGALGNWNQVLNIP